MSINRRTFMAGILASCTAPAFVRAESLMKIVVPNKKIFVPDQHIMTATEINERWEEFWRDLKPTILADRL